MKENDNISFQCKSKNDMNSLQLSETMVEFSLLHYHCRATLGNGTIYVDLSGYLSRLEPFRIVRMTLL